MEERVTQLEKELRDLKELYFKDNFTTSQEFKKDIIFSGKIGFFGKESASKGATVATVANPSGIYVQAEAQASATAINALVSRLQSYGLLP